MKIKDALVLLLLEALVVIGVISLFQMLDRQIAGLLGGFLFGLLGIFIGYRLVRKANYMMTFTFWWLFIYLFYSVLPMLYTRLSHWGVDFTQLKVWGMVGPEFHFVSEKIYAILILATCLDLSVALFKKFRRV